MVCLDANLIDVPLDKKCKLRVDLRSKIEDVNMYRSMVGSLIYLTITRTDLSYIVGLVNQFMQQPTKPHLDCIRRILRYIKTTQNYGLFYRVDLDIKLEGYTYVDWVGSQMTEDPQVDICLHWEVRLFRGVARNKLLLHYQVLKLNIEVQLQ